MKSVVQRKGYKKVKVKYLFSRARSSSREMMIVTYSPSAKAYIYITLAMPSGPSRSVHLSRGSIIPSSTLSFSQSHQRITTRHSIDRLSACKSTFYHSFSLSLSLDSNCLLRWIAPCKNIDDYNIYLIILLKKKILLKDIWVVHGNNLLPGVFNYIL